MDKKYYKALQNYILNTTFDEVECNDYEVNFIKRYYSRDNFGYRYWTTVIIQIFKDGNVSISKCGTRCSLTQRRSWENNGKFTIRF